MKTQSNYNKKNMLRSVVKRGVDDSFFESRKKKKLVAAGGQQQ